MKKLFLVIFILFSAPFLGFSQEESESAKTVFIETIEISGLKKTKESYVQNILKKYIGKDSSKLELKNVETDLQAEGIFSEVNATVQEKTLVVQVKEKITFLPLPFASYSSDGLMGGFMLMNMNAFGKKNNIIAGGVVKKNMYNGMVMFSKPAVDINHPGISTFFSVVYKENDITDFYKDTVYEADSFMIRGSLTLEEKISSFFKVSLDSSYSLANIWDHDEDPVVNMWLFGAKLSFSDVNWNGWYLLSNSLNLRSSIGFDYDGNFIQEYYAGGELNIPFVPRLRGVLKAAGTMNFNKNILFQATRGDVGSTILYSKFRTERIAASSFMLEGSIFKKKVATVAVYGSYECAVVKDADDSAVFAHGPGAGLRVYMQQVAFPAVVVGASYNIPLNAWQYVISIGVNM